MAKSGFTERLLKLLRWGSKKASEDFHVPRFWPKKDQWRYERSPDQQYNAKSQATKPSRALKRAKRFTLILPKIESKSDADDQRQSIKTSKLYVTDNHEQLASLMDFGPDGEDTLFIQDWGCDPGLSLTSSRSEESENSKPVVSEPAMKTSVSARTKKDAEPSDSISQMSEAALKVIAGNPRTQPGKLCQLAQHANPEMRATVARNSNALPETIWLLAKDHDEAVRLAVAEHLESHKSVLKALCNDPSPLVAWRARNTLSLVTSGTGTRPTPDISTVSSDSIDAEPLSAAAAEAQNEAVEQLSEEEIEFLQLIAHKASTPARRLAQLAKHPNARIRASVAENANTPVEALRRLSKDPVAEVKVKLADNYNCPLEIIERLQEDNDQYVAWRARSILAKAAGETYQDIVLEDESSRASPRLVHSH